MDHKYVFQLLFTETNHKIANNSTTTKTKEKNGTNLEFFQFKKLMYVCQNLKRIRFYLIELNQPARATDNCDIYLAKHPIMFPVAQGVKQSRQCLPK